MRLLYGLLTKREIKMAGCLPGFFFRGGGVEFDGDRVQVHKYDIKEVGRYPAILTEQAWSIKDLLYGKEHYFPAAQSG